MKYLKKFENNYNNDNLYFYIRTKNIEEIKELIEKTDVDINSKTMEGNTPLITSVNKDFLEGVKELIKAGAILDLTNNLNRTALWYTSYYSNIQIMNELIKAGANWNIKDNVNDEDFFDVLNYKYRKEIIDKYPEQYKQYKLKKEASKFNL